MSNNRKELLKRKKELEKILDAVCENNAPDCSKCPRVEECREYGRICEALAEC